MYDLQGQSAGILVRISDDREGRALGVKRQEQDARHLAERLGVILNDHIYVENDISGSAIAGEDRREFERFLADWQAGVFKVPLAYTTSRFTRDNVVAERVINIARQTGVSPCYVASPWCDLNTSAGRRMYRGLAVNDTGEAEDIQERVRGRKDQDAREGRESGGRRRYGYGKVIGINPATKREVRDPYQMVEEEIAVLKEGRDRTLAGDSQFTIMRDWSARDIKTSLGYDWQVGKFKRTMLNESYVYFDKTKHPTDCPCLSNAEDGGTRIHGDERHRAMWPGLFTQAEHDAMANIFNSRDSYWSNSGRLTGRTYLLSGIIYCGGIWRDTDKAGQVCGGYMYGQGKAYKTKEGSVYYRRYACKKWNRDGSRLGCCRVFRIADAVEAYVSEQVLYRFDSPEIANALAPSDNEERMVAVVQELAELQVRREQLAAEYAAGEHDKDDYQVMLKTLKGKIERADATKKQLLSDKAKSLAVPTDGGLRQLWDGASLEWRASVVKLVVDRVIIHPGRSGGTLWPDNSGWRFNPDLVEIVWRH